MVGPADAVDGGSAANPAGAAAAIATSRTVTVRNIGSSSLGVDDLGVTGTTRGPLRRGAVRNRTVPQALERKSNSVITRGVVLLNHRGGATMAKGTKQAQSKQNQNNQNRGKNATGQINRNAGAMGQSGRQSGGQSAGSNSAIEMLKQDHRKVEGLFQQFEQADDEQQKEQLVEQICSELIIHMRLEEGLFYPACREAGVEDDKMDESQVEHDGAKMLVNDLLDSDSDTPFFEAKVSVLKEMIKHHVEEEEKPGQGVLAQAKQHDIDDADLAQQMMRRKQEMQQRGVGRRPMRPVAIGMEDDYRQSMGGYSGDERFTGENE